MHLQAIALPARTHLRTLLLLLLCALLALGLAGCASLVQREPVRINVVGLEPIPGEGMEMRFKVKLRVQNPNESAIDFDGLALDLDLNPEALAIKAVLVALALAEHRMKPLVQVLVRPAPGMMNAHWVVSGDGSVEERPAPLSVVVAMNVLVNDAGVVPPAEGFTLHSRKVNFGLDRTEHGRPPTIECPKNHVTRTMLHAKNPVLA